MILGAEEIKALGCITPWAGTKQECEYSWGPEIAGYTLRLDSRWTVVGSDFWIDAPFGIPLKHDTPILCQVVEYIKVPADCIGLVFGKSSYAREGIRVYVTPLEPGWEGTLTLEVANDSRREFQLQVGQGIAQVMFLRLTPGSEGTYTGRYQNQPPCTGRLS